MKNRFLSLPDGCYKLKKSDLENIVMDPYNPKTRKGFQRKQRLQRVWELGKYAETGATIPPIVLVNTTNDDGKRITVCADGGHRLAAFAEFDFELWALVRTRPKNKAAREFCVLNGESKRVPLTHRLHVDTHNYARRVRDLADKYETNVQRIHNLMDGLCDEGAKRGARYPSPTEQTWSTAYTVMRKWTNDDRWDNRAFIYDYPGVLKLVGMYAKSSIDNVDKMKRGKWKLGSPMANSYGAAANAINRMRLMISKEVNGLREER